MSWAYVCLVLVRTLPFRKTRRDFRIFLCVFCKLILMMVMKKPCNPKTLELLAWEFPSAATTGVFWSRLNILIPFSLNCSMQQKHQCCSLDLGILRWTLINSICRAVMETRLNLASTTSNSVQNNNAVHLLRLHLLFLSATEQLRIGNTKRTVCIIEDDLQSLAV